MTQEKCRELFSLLRGIGEDYHNHRRDTQEYAAFVSLVSEFLLVYMADYHEDSCALCCALHDFVAENWSTSAMDDLRKACKYISLFFTHAVIRQKKACLWLCVSTFHASRFSYSMYCKNQSKCFLEPFRFKFGH